MLKEYSVHEVLAILNEFYIPCTQQSVTKWIREGKLPGVRTDYRKGGYRISEEDLYNFIEEERVGLPAIMSGYKEYIEMKKSQIISVIPLKNEEVVREFEKYEESPKVNEPQKKDEKNTEGNEIQHNAKVNEEIHIEETGEYPKMDSLEKNVHILLTAIEQMNEKFLMLEDKLIGILNRDNQHKNRQEETDKVSVSNNKPTKQNKIVSMEGFLSEKWGIVPEGDYSEEQIREQLKLVYHELFTEKGELKPSYFSNEKKDGRGFVLPSGGIRKTLKPFLKSYVKEYFKKENTMIKQVEINPPSFQSKNNSDAENSSKVVKETPPLLVKMDNSDKQPHSDLSQSNVENGGPP